VCPIDINLSNDDDHAYEKCYDLRQLNYPHTDEVHKMLTIAAIRSSNIFAGLPPRGSPIARRKTTSQAVINTPCQSSSFGKSKQSAIADPRSSERSVAIMATSDRI
jgi:hypothetical protein